MINPFLEKPEKGAKSLFYYSQFECILTGIEYANKISIFEGGTIAEARAYASIFRKKRRPHCRLRTTVKDGVLWLAFVEDK